MHNLHKSLNSQSWRAMWRTSPPADCKELDAGNGGLSSSQLFRLLLEAPRRNELSLPLLSRSAQYQFNSYPLGCLSLHIL